MASVCYGSQREKIPVSDTEGPCISFARISSLVHSTYTNLSRPIVTIRTSVHFHFVFRFGDLVDGEGTNNCIVLLHFKALTMYRTITYLTLFEKQIICCDVSAKKDLQDILFNIYLLKISWMNFSKRCGIPTPKLFLLEFSIPTAEAEAHHPRFADSDKPSNCCRNANALSVSKTLIICCTKILALYVWRVIKRRA